MQNRTCKQQTPDLTLHLQYGILFLAKKCIQPGAMIKNCVMITNDITLGFCVLGLSEHMMMLK